jgi:hypothetical protein
MIQENPSVISIWSEVTDQRIPSRQMKMLIRWRRGALYFFVPLGLYMATVYLRTATNLLRKPVYQRFWIRLSDTKADWDNVRHCPMWNIAKSCSPQDSVLSMLMSYICSRYSKRNRDADRREPSQKRRKPYPQIAQSFERQLFAEDL